MKAYCQEHGDAATMKIIRKFGIYDLCTMDSFKMNNRELLSGISSDTLSKIGYSDNYTRNNKSQSVEDILSDYIE